MASIGRGYGWDGTQWVPIKLDADGRMVIDQPVGGGGAGFTDDFSIGIKAADSNAAPTDDGTFLINLLTGDTIDAMSEGVQLGFPAGNFDDPNAAPTDANTAVIRVWASGCVDNDSSQTVPTRVNGANDGTKSAVKTNNSLGDLTNPVVLTTGAYTGCPTGGTFTSKTLRIWFDIPAGNTASADTITIIRNTTATGDVTLFTAGASAVDHSGGTFTADISALSLADLQTLTVRFSYQAAVVAVPLTVLNVDACAVDLAGGL